MARDPHERYQRMEKVTTVLTSIRDNYYPPVDLRETSTVKQKPASGGKPRLPFIPPIPKWAAAALAAILVTVSLFAVITQWPNRCLLAPELFAACRLPAEKHVAILPFEKNAASESNLAALDGIQQMLSSKLIQLARYEESLSPHETPIPEECGNRSILLKISTHNIGNEVAVRASLFNDTGKLLLRSITSKTGPQNMLRFQNGLLEEVAEMLELELHPEVLRAMARADTEVEAAFQAYIRGLGYLKDSKHDLAIEEFELARDLDAGYSTAFAGLGEALRLKHNLTRNPGLRDEAISNCNRVIQLDSWQAQAHYTLGSIYFEAQHFSESADEFKLALECNPLSLETRNSLAATYEAEGLLEEAKSVYRAGADLRPDFWVMHYHLGIFCAKNRFIQDAEREFLRTIELAPNNPAPYNSLGAFYISDGLYEKAVSVLQKSLEKKPLERACSNTGAAYFHLGCYTDAAKWLLQATKLGSNSSRIWGNLGECRLMVKELRDEAEEAFAQAIHLSQDELSRNPENHSIVVNLAQWRARLGEKQKSYEAIGQALALAPKNISIRYRAGLVYELIGMRSLALDSLEMALKGGYSTEEACAEPIFEDLRLSPRFQRLVKGGCEPVIASLPKVCPAWGDPISIAQ